MSSTVKQTPGPTMPDHLDPHVDAVVTGLRNKAFGMRKAVSILEDCGFTKDDARAAIAKAKGGAE